MSKQDTDKVSIEVPEGWTERRVLELLEKLNAGEPVITTIRSATHKPTHHCWKGGFCYFWELDGDENEPWKGRCRVGSVTCITACANGKQPTRWLDPEEVSNRY